MTKKRTSRFALALLVVAMAVTAARAEKVLLTKENYARYMVGNTVLGVKKYPDKDVYWKTFFLPSNRRFFELEDGRLDEGKHWFNDKGEICTAWEVLRDGAVACSNCWIDGDRFYYLDKDDVKQTRKLVKGEHKGWNHADWK